MPDAFDVPFQYQYPFPEMPYDEYMREMQWWRLTYRTAGWTWIQSLTRGNTAYQYLDFARSDRAGLVPDPEQIRLQVYWALTRGMRGIFFQWLTMSFEPSRMAECSLLANELSLVGEHLVAGDVRGWKAWSVDFPQVRPLRLIAAEEGRIEITVPEMDVSALVFLSRDERNVQPIRKQMAEKLPALTRMFVEALPDRYKRVHDIYARCAITVGKADGHFNRAQASWGGFYY